MNAESLKDLLDDPEAHDGLNDGILFAELAGMPKFMMDTEHARLLYDRAALAPQLAEEVIKLQAEVERMRGNQSSGSYLEKLIKVHNHY